MTVPIGRKRWAIAEGYIPGGSHGTKPQMTSHETACILNASDRDARVEITVYFTDREPAGPYRLTVPARRTRHLRFNQLNDPEPIPEPPGWHADSRFTRRRGDAETRGRWKPARPDLSSGRRSLPVELQVALSLPPPTPLPDTTAERPIRPLGQVDDPDPPSRRTPPRPPTPGRLPRLRVSA